MTLFKLFKRGSAPIARERLQILLSHERDTRNRPDLLGVLREEILAVISRHVAFDPEKVQITVERGNTVSTLAVDIEIPHRRRMADPVPHYSRLAFDTEPAPRHSQWTNGLV